MNPNLSSTLPVPIGRDALRFAKQFATEQATPEKGKQVYLNTLAVVAVRDYLRWLSIPTAIERGDCWHPAKRAMFNVADLVLPPLGKLECLPILPQEKDFLEIPPESADNRLGYVAVRFGEELKQVELLGFVSAQEIAYPPEPVPLAKLNPIDDLIDTIDWHRKWANLWQHLSQPEWQPVELLLAPSRRSLGISTRSARNFRTKQSLESGPSRGEVGEGERADSVKKPRPLAQSFSRGKVIEWENDNLNIVLLLTVKIGEDSTEEIDVKIRLYPHEENTYLPEGLEVSVVDESGVVCMKTQAREQDGWIELELGCEPQEQFSLQIILNGNKAVENFKI